MATALESTTAKTHRLAALREFLMVRRARVSPAEAGLPGNIARRRTPGLRREEVAVLAGVGTSWYQWFEQGRDITVSPQVVEAVARVLRMNPTERRHLYVLAGLNPPPPEVDPESRGGLEGLRRLIETWMPFPAHVMDAYWNIVMYNDAASLILGLSPDGPQNCLLSFFTDPRYRGPAGNWETVAPKVVAQYRAAWSERPEDEGFQAVVAEAKSASEEFARLWEQHDVLPGGQDSKVVEHPLVGTLHLETTQLRLPARPDLAILLYTPLPVAETAAKVEWLVSPEGRDGSAYPVAG